MAFGNVPPSDALFGDYMPLGEWAKQINRLILKYGHGRGFMYSSLGPELGNVAPAVVSAITISGDLAEDDVLSLAGNSWYGDPTLSYQWQRDEEDIAGATAATHTIVVADSGADLTCIVTGVNHFGTSEYTTAAVTAD
jgi:hypothetical protein